MIIEFYTPHGEVSEHVIFFIKEKLMDFYHRNHGIYGAEVVLRTQHLTERNDHVCEVTLSINSGMLMIHRSAKSFMQAARAVVEELSLKVDEFLQRQQEPAARVTSTVTV